MSKFNWWVLIDHNHHLCRLGGYVPNKCVICHARILQVRTFQSVIFVWCACKREVSKIVWCTCKRDVLQGIYVFDVKFLDIISFKTGVGFSFPEWVYWIWQVHFGGQRAWVLHEEAPEEEREECWCRLSFESWFVVFAFPPSFLSSSLRNENDLKIDWAVS